MSRSDHTKHHNKQKIEAGGAGCASIIAMISAFIVITAIITIILL